MDPQIFSPPVGPPSGIWILDFHAIRSHLTSLELTLDAALHQVRCCSFCRHSGFRILDLRVLGHFSLVRQGPPPPPSPARSWILDLGSSGQNIPKKASFPSDPKSRIQNPGPRTLREWVGGGATLDPGSWILDLQPIAPKKASIAKIQNPRSGADLYTGRQNCASSLRKRSLDEGLMSFLEIQCVPSGGPEPPQDHRSRLRGSKGAFRCWQGQDHEARSKTPVTTIQKHKPLLEIPMGPP